MKTPPSNSLHDKLVTFFEKVFGPIIAVNFNRAFSFLFTAILIIILTILQDNYILTMIVLYLFGMMMILANMVERYIEQRLAQLDCKCRTSDKSHNKD
ncbi:hypothetical protein [Psychrobium sp. 1_MG-2023]|uniref:hypothetical protein n=1 Tax=Psychrobium sp. 1_MG-2023 TaxID=3062624 RepID=UPI000C345D07|nr:hypothetical protein [Psychrobium sp. 1_MG-2023]MDP2562961.1 hypothetical protein [Psychrobium sp. 1_MG-2023]PKF54245.1 hypothetical protein CW748_16580 [Alteromonadales bacterium alter-6D02]